MFVKDQMTPDPITVTQDIPVIDAQEIMQRHNIRHLPVVDDRHHLVGLLTRETMLRAVPWSQSALSTLETQYILSKIKAGKVMFHDIITTTENVPVEEAARIMVDHKIGCLPVIRDRKLVGIITDIDLLGTIYACRAVLPGIIDNGGNAHIALISSLAGLLGVYGYSAYGAAKFGVRGLGEVLRQ